MYREKVIPREERLTEAEKCRKHRGSAHWVGSLPQAPTDLESPADELQCPETILAEQLCWPQRGCCFA